MMLTILFVALFLQPQGAYTATTLTTTAEFMNIKEVCPGEELCGPTHPTDIPSAKCVCSEDCWIYGDCCRNSEYFDPTATSTNPYTCVTEQNGRSFYMNAKCPPKTSFKERQLCENPKPSPDPVANNLPITVFSAQGTRTYRNANCAKCNGAPLTSAEIWVPRLECFDHTAMDSTARENLDLRWNATNEGWTVFLKDEPAMFDCNVEFTAPYNILNLTRECKSGGFTDTCLPNWKGTREEQLCQRYTAYVVANQTVYKNTYCVQCNEVEGKVDCVDISLRGIGRSATFSALLRDPEKDPTGCKKNEVYDAVFERCRNIVCPLDLPNCLDSEDTTVPKGSNVSRIDSCARIVFENGTFELSKDEHVVHITKYDINYTDGEFIINVLGQAEICARDLPRVIDRFSYFMGIVTVVGLGLSIFFLVLHLFAVVLVPDLRNHSGMNLSSLCVALLGAYISFIVGAFLNDSSRKCCATVAVLTYYFFLSAFFWMLVLAYDVWRVLRGAVLHFQTSHGRQWCRFVIYSLFAWGMSALLTLAAILVEMAPQGSVDDRLRPQFGRESCWFSRRLSLVLFFATPLAVVMSLNVIFFMSSAFMASRTRSASASSNVTGHHQRDFRLYLRLGVLLGLTWVVGLLATFLDIEILWIAFVLLNTLQGLFIFAVFTCTSKVANSLLKPHPWANRLRRSFNLPSSKPNLTPSSDVGFSQSTSDSMVKTSGTSTTVEAFPQSRPSPSPRPMRKSSRPTHLEVAGLPRRSS